MSGQLPIPIPVVEQSLYEARRKIHPRTVSGWFNNWRWGLVAATQLVFYGLPWLQWNGRQAVLFDLAARKFYLFGLVLWPQDVVYLTAILIISALSLFLFTAIAGRVWCGYACPQTVYTEIFMWIERRIEGERSARIKLDAARTGPRKIALRSAKHAVWIAVALWTGFTFVGFFAPIHDLLGAAGQLALSPWESFWVLFYGFATYGNAGWMREQVCKHMCPYARFQSAMFDQDTMVVTYDARRGDPRGGRARNAAPHSLGLGDCIDCSICVQVCPTGIDIRDGLQYECIGCAACIDGCDAVMDKMGYPRGLIRYSTENALQQGADWHGILARVLRPRTIIYATILGAICAATVVALVLRSPVKMDVMRERASLVREIEGGRIENLYRVQLMNTEETAFTATLSASTARGEPLEVLVDEKPITMAPLSTRMLTARVRGDPAQGHGSQPIELVLRAEFNDSRSVALREKTRMLFPEAKR